jgi:hypothetical protein
VKERHKPFYERKLSRDERMQVTYGLYSEHMCDLRLYTSAIFNIGTIAIKKSDFSLYMSEHHDYLKSEKSP